MPSLIIQDAFAPYYADRESFPATPGPLAATPKKGAPPPKIAQPEQRQPTEADKITEH
jgi:hypothetical protein